MSPQMATAEGHRAVVVTFEDGTHTVELAKVVNGEAYIDKKVCEERDIQPGAFRLLEFEEIDQPQHLFDFMAFELERQGREDQLQSAGSVFNLVGHNIPATKRIEALKHMVKATLAG